MSMRKILRTLGLVSILGSVGCILDQESSEVNYNTTVGNTARVDTIYAIDTVRVPQIPNVEEITNNQTGNPLSGFFDVDSDGRSDIIYARMKVRGIFGQKQESGFFYDICWRKNLGEGKFDDPKILYSSDQKPQNVPLQVINIR